MPILDPQELLMEDLHEREPEISPYQRALLKAYDKGMDVSQHHKPDQCPYKRPDFRDAWFTGYARGCKS